MPDDHRSRPFLTRLRACLPRLREIYLTFDRRSLGLCRIGLASLLLYDLWRRVPGLQTWYTNDGLLPNHTVLWRPNSQWLFSLFYTASWANEATFLFSLCGLAYLGLLIGWHTRLCHVLSMVAVVSLHTRVVFTENGGDVALNLLCAWTLFFPMHARFSVDAVLASLRRREERTVAELNDRRPLAPDTTPFVSLGVLAILLQLAIIYYFNALSKRGMTWRNGTAVHYVLQQERMITWLAWKVRAYSSLRASQFATYSTLAVEALAPALILSPFFRTFTRRMAVLVIPSLHLSFALLLNVGMFSFNMIGYFPLLLSSPDWERLGRHFAPGEGRARVVYVDADSRLCFSWARLLARLDTFSRLRFAALSEAPNPADGHQAHSIDGVRQSAGYDAVTACVAALPFGCLPATVLHLPGIRALGRLLYGALAKRLKGVQRGTAPAAEAPGAAVPTVGEVGTSVEATATRGVTAGSARDRRMVFAREAAIAVLAVALGSQVLMENKVVPSFLKRGQADWMKQVVAYPRLFQGWAMFTPDAPMGERMVYVDAVTIGGRHVDPYNEAASRVSTLPVAKIPPFMDQDEFWCDYTNRIPENGAYFGPLKEWISKYHTRTGRAEDRVVSYEVFLIESDSPPPGEVGARNIRTRSLLRDSP